MSLRWINDNDEAVAPHSIPDDEIWGVEIDGETFAEGDDTTLIYEEVFQGFAVEDLPEKFAFELVNYFDNNGNYEPGSLPFEIVKADGVLAMSVLDGAWPKGRSQEFDEVELERLAIALRVLTELKTHEDWLADVVMNEEDVHYGGAILQYTIVAPADVAAEVALALLKTRYETVVERVDSLMGERTLSGILKSGNEQLFTHEVVIPALERLGMQDVRYVHGADEHGRDVLYRYQHPLGFDIVGAVQCKAGDVTGRAGQKVDEILAQIEDSFAFPVYDLNIKAERPVCEVIVAISGEFKGSSIQRIKQRLQVPTASRVWFWSARDFLDMAK